MSLKHILCATALTLGVMGAAAPASADPGRGHDRGGPGWHDGRGQNRGLHRGWNHRGRPHCRTEWRHHRRVRVCR